MFFKYKNSFSDKWVSFLTFPLIMIRNLPNIQFEKNSRGNIRTKEKFHPFQNRTFLRLFSVRFTCFVAWFNDPRHPLCHFSDATPKIDKVFTSPSLIITPSHATPSQILEGYCLSFKVAGKMLKALPLQLCLWYSKGFEFSFVFNLAAMKFRLLYRRNLSVFKLNFVQLNWLKSSVKQLTSSVKRDHTKLWLREKGRRCYLLCRISILSRC